MKRGVEGRGWHSRGGVMGWWLLVDVDGVCRVCVCVCVLVAQGKGDERE